MCTIITGVQTALQSIIQNRTKSQTMRKTLIRNVQVGCITFQLHLEQVVSLLLLLPFFLLPFFFFLLFLVSCLSLFSCRVCDVCRITLCWCWRSEQTHREKEREIHDFFYCNRLEHPLFIYLFIFTC